MIYLLIASFIWAFSFSLIKGNLIGLDSNMVSFIRLLISFIIFLPFFRTNKLTARNAVKLIGIGAIQYGIMYTSYIYSYQFLKAHQVALFTIFTPIYVTVINDIFEKKINRKSIYVTLLAIVGAFIIVFKHDHPYQVLNGFLIIQISNISFALGQIWYKHLRNKAKEIKDTEVFSLLFLGGTLISATFTFSKGIPDISIITQKQWITLLYLGVIASGIAFFLWNFGAVKVKATILAVFNNIKIPLAILVSLLVFNEKADPIPLFIGSGLIFYALYFSIKKT